MLFESVKVFKDSDVGERKVFRSEDVRSVLLLLLLLGKLRFEVYFVDEIIDGFNSRVLFGALIEVLLLENFFLFFAFRDGRIFSRIRSNSFSTLVSFPGFESTHSFFFFFLLLFFSLFL